MQTSASLATSVGLGLSVLTPLPSWPSVPRPQQNTEPLARHTTPRHTGEWQCLAAGASALPRTYLGATQTAWDSEHSMAVMPHDTPWLSPPNPWLIFSVIFAAAWLRERLCSRGDGARGGERT